MGRVLDCLVHPAIKWGQLRTGIPLCNKYCIVDVNRVCDCIVEYYLVPQVVLVGTTMQNTVNDVMLRRDRSRLFFRSCCFSEKKAKLITQFILFGGLGLYVNPICCTSV